LNAYNIPTLFFHYHQIKKRVTVTTHVTNPLDVTLEALKNIQDAVDEIKVRKNITSEKEKLQDYDKIIQYLENSASNLLNAVVIFQKHEKAL